MRELTEKQLAEALKECDDYQVSTGLGNPSARQFAEEQLAGFASWMIPELVEYAKTLDERRQYGADIINDMKLEAELDKRHITVLESRLQAALKFRVKLGFSQVDLDGHITDEFPEGWKTHELKTWPEEYHALDKGLKTAELRCNDRNFQVGDHLLLHEYYLQADRYTGAAHYQEITHIVAGPAFGVIEGYVMLSLQRLPF